VLTTKSFIRTVTHIKPEWLLELAPVYYDLSEFKDNEVKTSLRRVEDRMRRKEALSKKSAKGR
jgi:pre-mRNA-splicing factor ATP-dependent RNA helicase DHX15/PRP43